jgi:hypothetical protein
MDRIDLEPFRRALVALRDGPESESEVLAAPVQAAIASVAGTPKVETPA